MELYKYIQIMAYAVAAIAGLIVIYFTWKIYRVKYQHAELEKDIAQKRLQAIDDEASNRTTVLNQTAAITTEISQSISQKLIENPSWLDRFMDETGITYSASVYGKRIGHFFYEKRKIAEAAVDRVDEYLKKNDSTRYCLVIDSGTTLYPVFEEIANRLRRGPASRLWRERICIVTNNIPGVQYLMKNAKDSPNDDYSEIAVKCFIIPGKPLSVYAAITGDESTRWLQNLKAFLSSKEFTKDLKSNQGDDTDIKVLGFVTGNYMARRVDNNKSYYYPVARGEGHVEIKRMMVDVSDEVFLLAPLMKFSFASVDLLNRVNGFDVERVEGERAKQHPSRIKYEPVAIPDNKKCVFFTTKRSRDAIFGQFSHDLYVELATHHKTSVIMPEFDVRYWNPAVEGNRHIELKREIPHDNLREKIGRAHV